MTREELKKQSMKSYDKILKDAIEKCHTRMNEASKYGEFSCLVDLPCSNTLPDAKQKISKALAEFSPEWQEDNKCIWLKLSWD